MFTIIYSDAFLDHKTGSYHPEKPARLTAIVDHLKGCNFADQLDWKLPTKVEDRPDLLSIISQVHTVDYIQSVEKISAHGGGSLDGDTPVSARTYDIALLAVNGWLDGVDYVMNTGHPIFVLARPPGHHAVKDRGMGFCIFSNAAIAANYALQLPNVNKVAILDWDVHHGNGTEYIIESNPHIFYCSLHQYPCYPGTGKASYTGKYNNVLNIPMTPGSGMSEYETAFTTQVMPFLRNVQPDLLIISAGYDANEADQLAGINLHPEDFGTFTEYCLQITSKILFGLEGGYDLDAIARSVKCTIEKCL